MEIIESPYEELDFTKNTEDKVYLNDIQEDSICKKQPDIIQPKQNLPLYVSSSLGNPSFSQQTTESSSPRNEWSIYDQAGPSNNLDVTVQPPNGKLYLFFMLSLKCKKVLSSVYNTYAKLFSYFVTKAVKMMNTDQK